MQTEWNPAKNEANKAKHGLDFASFEGFDVAPVIIADDRYEYGEARFRAFGRVDGQGRCLVYTLRDGTMWIISYRRAHEKEMRRYE